VARHTVNGANFMPRLVGNALVTPMDQCAALVGTPRTCEKCGTNLVQSTRTLRASEPCLVENTPQRCRYNYGSAIYVPTSRGHGVVGDDHHFQAFQQCLQDALEPSSEACCVRKCNFCGSSQSRPHACYKQSWWPDPTSAAALEKISP